MLLFLDCPKRRFVMSLSCPSIPFGTIEMLKRQIGKLTEGLLLEELNDRTIREIVERLQRKYAPRTVQLHVVNYTVGATNSSVRSMVENRVGVEIGRRFPCPSR